MLLVKFTQTPLPIGKDAAKPQLEIWFSFRSGLDHLEQRQIPYSCWDTDHDSTHSQFTILNYFGFTVVYI